MFNEQEKGTESHMKFLVIRFSSIGDILLCTPVFRLLKLKFPHAEIHFVTKADFSNLSAYFLTHRDAPKSNTTDHILGRQATRF